MAKIKISSAKKVVVKTKKVIRSTRKVVKRISKAAITKLKQISIPFSGQAEAILKKVKNIPSDAKLKRVITSRKSYLKHAKAEIKSLKKKIVKAKYDIVDLKKKLKSSKKKDAHYFRMKKLLAIQNSKIHKLRSIVNKKSIAKRKTKKILSIFKKHAEVKKS